MGQGAAVEAGYTLRTTDITWQPLDDDIVVLDLRSSRYLRLNDTAALLWRRLETGATRDQLVAAIVEEYDVEPDVAQRDVDAALASLLEHELLAER